VIWHDADGFITSNLDLKDEITNYTNLGGTVYVGADSMLYNTSCSFASVIAMHDRNKKIAKYFYKKKKILGTKYSNLELKILEEVQLSIECANFVLSLCPSAQIEVHVDIGCNKRNLTSKFYNLIKGWLKGLGFEFKVKPDSWASSSIADWHTK